MDDLLINSGFTLGIMGYIGYLLRDIPSIIKLLFLQYKSNSIQVTNDEYHIYNISISWLLKLCPKLKAHVAYIHSDSTSLQQISDGLYFYQLDWLTYILINKFQMSAQTINQTRYEVSITLLGKNREHYVQQYQEYINQFFPNRNNVLKLKYNTTFNGLFDKMIPYKNFDDIFFNKKNEIMQLLDNFVNNQSFYQQHGIIYKTGILLYGPPGSGKSSIARAIASYLKWEIYYINIASKTLPTWYNNNTVFIFEDIDCLVASRDNENERLSLHEVLNFIDGMLSPNNAIFIATTNYIDKIDPALVRQGRFDLQYEVPYMDYSLASEMCKRYNIDKSLLNDIEFPVSPAIIQNNILFKMLGRD